MKTVNPLSNEVVLALVLLDVLVAGWVAIARPKDPGQVALGATALRFAGTKSTGKALRFATVDPLSADRR